MTPTYYRCSIEMIRDIKFKRLYQKYGRDFYPINWMWDMILAEGTKRQGFFCQAEDVPHDDLSLMAVFDLVGITHGVEFIRNVMDEFTSKEYKLLTIDENGTHYITQWAKYQDACLSTPRTQKHRAKLKDEQEVTEILEMMNSLTGKSYRTETESYRKLVRGRLSEGFTKEDFKKVIIWKIQKWGKDEKMKAYIRPDTLFRPGHFDTYLNEIPRGAQQPTELDLKVQYPMTPDQATPAANTLFSVTDIYGRRHVITQAQFDKAEEGYFTKN